MQINEKEARMGHLPTYKNISEVTGTEHCAPTNCFTVKERERAAKVGLIIVIIITTAVIVIIISKNFCTLNVKYFVGIQSYVEVFVWKVCLKHSERQFVPSFSNSSSYGALCCKTTKAPPAQ